jgi:hypothetical protein
MPSTVLSRRALAVGLSAALALASSVATAMQASASFTVSVLLTPANATVTRVGCPVDASGLESCTAVTYSQYEPSVQVRLFAVAGSTGLLGGTSGFLAGSPGVGSSGGTGATLRAAQPVGSSTKSTTELFSDAYADTRLLSTDAGEEIREVLYSW